MTMKQYMNLLGDPHSNCTTPCSVNKLDFELRNLMGKEDSPESICSHDAIIRRELGENFCRVCHKDLRKMVGRYNDYLVIRNAKCQSPICLECSKNRPDFFHIKFKEAIKKLEEKIIGKED